MEIFFPLNKKWKTKVLNISIEYIMLSMLI